MVAGLLELWMHRQKAQKKQVAQQLVCCLKMTDSLHLNIWIMYFQPGLAPGEIL